MNVRVMELLQNKNIIDSMKFEHRDNYNDSYQHDTYHDRYDDRYFDSHYDDTSRYDDSYQLKRISPIQSKL